jgi:hypothetical protein
MFRDNLPVSSSSVNFLKSLAVEYLARNVLTSMHDALYTKECRTYLNSRGNLKSRLGEKSEHAVSDRLTK